MRPLNEMPIARPGDMPSEPLGDLNEFTLKRYWIFQGRINQLAVFRHKIDACFLVGDLLKSFDQDNEPIQVLKPLLEIRLVREKSLGFRLGYQKLYRVDLVRVQSSTRGQGVGSAVYRWLVKSLGFSLVSDSDQFFGARALWKSISRDPELTVDLVDIRTAEKIKSDIQIQHGRLDQDFDPEIWSLNQDKKDIRLILTAKEI